MPDTLVGDRIEGTDLMIDMSHVAGAIPTLVELGAAKDITIDFEDITIDFDDADLTGDVAVAVIEAVRRARKLSLCFCFVNGGRDFFDNLSNAMSSNENLHTFRIKFGGSVNSVDIAAIYLADVLGGHITLRSFSFDGCIGDDACVMLVESLCGNEYLREIELSINEANPAPEQRAVEEMKRVLDENYTLVAISITNFDEDGALSIICDNVSKRNQSLWAQRRALKTLAQFNGYGFDNLASLSFRNKILEFFVPQAFAFQSSLHTGAVKVDAREVSEAPGQIFVDGLEAPAEFVADHDELPAVIEPVEAEWLQEEQRNSFIEHRLANKIENSPNISNRTIVLLSFSRLSKELEVALLDSSPAEVVRADDVDVLPGWAGGAKVFVHGIGADDLNPSLLDMLKCSSVLMYEDDVCDLIRELKEDKGLPLKLRKVKRMEGLPSVPEELSLMNTSSHDSAESDEASDPSSDSAEFVVTVRNMFLEIAAGSSHRSVLSANF